MMKPNFLARLIIFSLLGICVLLGWIVQQALAIEVTRTRTGVLLNNTEKAYPGYTLLQTSPEVFLIDTNGYIVHRWRTGGGGDAQLTKEGTLLRASGALNDYGNPLQGPGFWGGTQGRLREWKWDGELVWDIELAAKDWISHHTFHRMPNGNTLVLIWERYSRQDAIRKGRHPLTVNPEGATGTEPRPGVYIGDFWPDKIIEIEKTGKYTYKTVWEWRAWDYLCNRTDPKCIDINYRIPRPTDITHRSSADFMHANAVDYDPVNDLIVLNSRVLGEFYLIDHKTGDIVYRWGNPCAWDKKAICPSYMEDGETWLFGAHGANFVASEAGRVNIVVFDNGWLRPSGNRSRALEVEIELGDPDYYKNPIAPKWSFQTASANSLFSEFVSYAQRLGNGNTLITSGTEAHIIEVTESGEIVWEYVVPRVINGKPQCENVDGVGGGFVFRSYRYGEDYEGLGLLTENTPYPDPADCP
jgi:hypothetical protein